MQKRLIKIKKKRGKEYEKRETQMISIFERDREKYLDRENTKEI